MESDSGKLFIGGISWDTNDDRLREYFEGFGEVVEAVIMKDRTTGRARGFGFVLFADPSVAEKVVLLKHVIDGRTVEAKKAVPRDDQQILTRNTNSIQGSPGPGRTKKIFVGGLPSTVTELDFKQYFDQFGTITDVVVMYDHNTQRHRGFGFITYESEDSVDKALVKTFHELNGKMVEVKRAVPKELSPGPNVRSPISGYNFGLNRANNFISGYTPGYNPSLIGSYGVRMDGRFGQPGSGRSGFPSLGPGYGMGLNFEPGLSPSYGGNSNFGSNFGYGRAVNPYFSGNSSRYTSPIGYGGGNGSPGSVFSSAARNLWANNNLSYAANSANTNAYMASGSGNIGGFGNGSLSWGGSSPPPISVQGAGSGSNYAGGNMGYGNGDNGFSLGPISVGRNSGNGSMHTSLTPSSNGYEGKYTDIFGGSSIYDRTWQSASPDLDGPGPFGYRLENSASDAAAKASASYMGGYNVTNQTIRGVAT